MKKIIFIIMAVIGCTLAGCGDDEWGNGDPAMEHVYYVGFQEWTAKFDNSYVYNMNVGETLAIPVQFWSERVRSYDVTTFYYVAGSLVRGTDYDIVDEKGTVLTPNDKGAFTLTWKQAVKGVQKVYIKAKTKTGSFLLQTHDPKAEVPISNKDVSSTLHNKTNDYEVRSFSQNYKVTVNIK